ncbi:MAG: hypothetical protein Q7J27_04220 [Syntrophales bacterium]|nr:hypothetical protein [Syntrophales bacterium]
MITFDNVQIGILIVIAAQVGVLIWQTGTLKDHFKIQQRPFVGVSEIRSVVLGDNTLQSEIGGSDELLITVVFKNIGKSCAFVKYIKVKMFYGYFHGDKKKPSFRIVSLFGKTSKSSTPVSNVNKEVPIESIVCFKDSVLFPNQTTDSSTMVDAKQLMDQIRAFTSSREAPIFIECEVSYTDIDKSEQCWYNCLYELQWVAAKHITIYSNLIRSNVDNKPIHLTYRNFFNLVAQRQKVKPAIDANTINRNK